MEKETMGSADRVLTIQKLLSEKQSLSVAETASLLDIDKSTAYRLLKKIESYGFASKNGKMYYYTSPIQKLSYLEPTSYAVANFSKNLLKTMVQQTKIGAHLCMLSQNGAIFISQEFPSDIVRIVQPVGKEEPFHCTASGKVMLAYLPQEIRTQLLDGIEFKSFTEHTITSKDVFLEQLDKIREQGYALDEGEFHPNINCICVPVYDAFNIPKYALGFSQLMLPDEQFDVPALKRILTKYAGKISHFLCKRYPCAES